MFDGGELRLVLLHLLREESRHGYDLIRAIEGLSRGTYAPSPGMVYPSLTALKELGLVAEPSSEGGEGTRRLYVISKQGRAYLQEHAKIVRELLQRLADSAKLRDRTEAAPVRRAMNSLKSALMDRLSEEVVDKELVFQIAAIIDEAAQKIERL